MNHEINSVWITANAGSGKTTALTERVVRLLLLGVAPERIVCITYTKAAASEMRMRVLEWLRALLLDGDEACRARIEKILGVAADETLLAHARGLFGAVLDSPGGGLQLMTIHGFCQNLLRRFPMEAGVAPHFTVLEDAAAEEMLRLAKHRMLERFSSGDAWLVEALTLIGARSGEFRFDALMGDIIRKRGAWAQVWRNQSPESLRAYLFALHGLAEGATRETLAATLCNAPNAADAAVIRGHLPDMLAHKKKTENKYAAGFAAWLEVVPEHRGPRIGALCTLMLTDGALRKDVAKLEQAADGAMMRLADAVLAYNDAIAALACAEESFAIAVLAKALLELYAQAKMAAHALDYDDLIGKTVALCAHPSTLGWVMSKLDHRIDHLLIDEAQDTSADQWALVRTLVEELIASNDGIGSAGLPRSLLVVGDEKQSIYSFQGAAPELFAHHHQHFAALLEGSPSPLETQMLDTSYRSAAAVLRLVDHVAAQPAVAAALSASGMIQPHRLHRTAAAGSVTLYPLVIAPEKERPAALTIPTEYLIIKTAAQLLAETVAERIAQWLLVERRPLKSAGRALRAGDILILVRSRKPLVLPLIRALQRRAIPVAGLDRLTLAEHLAVRDLLALMGWCMNVNDDLALAQVLRSPLIGLSDEGLRAMAHGRPASLWAQTEQPLLTHWLSLKHTTPYDFLTDVLEVSGARQQFARRFGEEVHEVLDELKAQAAAMPAHMPPTLAHFYAWMDGSSRQVKREQEAAQSDHVRIMTVHGAKGLEAPVVLLVDTVSMPTTQHERMYFAQGQQHPPLPLLSLSPEASGAAALLRMKQEKADALTAEYDRLLYVALTRARDELHLFGTASKKGEAKAGSWYALAEQSLRALGAVEDDGLLTFADALPAGQAAPLEAGEAPVLALPEWATRAPAVLRQVAMAAPSQLAAVQASPYAQGAAAGAKERGVRIHRVLELLRAESDARHIAQLVAYVAPDWTPAQQHSVVQEIAALFAQERWLWEHELLPEASITGTITVDGVALAISGQMDLLVKTPEAIIIADYKTGHHVPADASGVSANYVIQLKTYHALVSQLYPGLPVRCAIIWTSAPRLMWLDDAVRAAAFPKQNVMLKTAVAS
ncbi:MAG: UvrD-helicase domain-containing protein [Pseudomonadota bacterium]